MKQDTKEGLLIIGGFVLLCSLLSLGFWAGYGAGRDDAHTTQAMMKLPANAQKVWEGRVFLPGMRPFNGKVYETIDGNGRVTRYTIKRGLEYPIVAKF